MTQGGGRIALLAACALVLTTVACGGSDGPRTTAVFRYTNTDDPTGADRVPLVTIVGKRLAAFGITDVELKAEDEAVTVTVGDYDEAQLDQAFAALERPGRFQVRPVLAIVATTAPGLTAPEDDVYDAEVRLAERDGDGEITAVYDLGPSASTGSPIDSAEAEEANGAWTVRLELSDDELEAFNEAAADCDARARSCPTGRLAIIVDGQVLAAPTVEQPSYDPDQIQLAGRLDEAGARELAVVLDSGRLPVELELETRSTDPG